MRRVERALTDSVQIAVIAQNAYITNSGDGIVTVIDTATSTIRGTIPVGSGPWGTAVTPDGSKVYVANSVDNTVSVIHTATNSVASTIVLGAVTAADRANAVAISPDGNTVYITSYIDGTTNPFCGPPPEGAGPPCFQAVISVIDAATDTVVETIPLPVVSAPLYILFSSILGMVVSPDGSEVYVSFASGTQYGFLMAVCW